jgi:hypothetical protein
MTDCKLPRVDLLASRSNISMWAHFVEIFYVRLEGSELDYLGTGAEKHVKDCV